MTAFGVFASPLGRAPLRAAAHVTCVGVDALQTPARRHFAARVAALTHSQSRLRTTFSRGPLSRKMHPADGAEHQLCSPHARLGPDLRGVP